jgi:Polyketide cyclase / dehydrase and lipid transport
MTWIILLIIALFAFLLWVSRQPDTFRLERSTTINAPAHDIFGWINNVKRFNQWNPWAQLDPAATMTFSGPEEGPGASYAWQGKKSGQGSSTLRSQSPPTEVVFALDIVKPMQANNTVSFTLRETAGATTVNWAMTGSNNFVGKLFQTFVSLDKMVGKDFDKGLASLKMLVEQKKVN